MSTSGAFLNDGKVVCGVSALLQQIPLSCDSFGVLNVNATLTAGSISIGKVDQGTPALPASAWPITLTDSAGVNQASVSAAGAVKVDGSAVTQPVSGTFWQTTQPVSGTFWQATQPVSVATLPLPSGAATEATLSTLNGKVTACNTGAVVVSSSALPAGASTEATLSTLNGKVTACNTGAVVVSSSALPAGASTAAKQPALGVAGTASSDVITVQGIASMTKLLVTPDSVALPANQSVNVSQVAGTTTDTNSGSKSAGTLRVVLATDQPQLTNKLLVTPDANSAVNVAQLAGTTTDTNSGNKSAGTLRVVLATDQPALSTAMPVSESGTWTVQPGNTPNTSPWLVTQTPATSGGLTTYHLVSAASTNATVVKNAAGQLFGWFIYNNSAAVSKVAFHNASTTPTAGASIFFSLPIPAGGAANIHLTNGIPFSTGIAITTVTGIADSSSTAVAANDLVINLWYK